MPPAVKLSSSSAVQPQSTYTSSVRSSFRHRPPERRRQHAVPSPGHWVDVSPRPKFAFVGAPDQEHFIGRSSEVAEILDLVVRRKHRLVTIRGAPGIGKTSLVASAGRYLSQRSSPPSRAGVVFVSLRGATTVQAVLLRLYRALQDAMLHQARDRDRDRDADGGGTNGSSGSSILEVNSW